MGTREIIKKRRSIREYKDKLISDEILLDLIDCGHMAPTARGEEPWEFIVIKNKETLKEISRLTNRNALFLKEASACIVIFSRPTKYYLEDCSAATENILLAATSYGIASCWIAGDKKDYVPDIKILLKAPSEYNLISIISLGYPKNDLITKAEKRPLDELLHWEKF
ncbi:MAG: nitroreductase family protein [Candidatus Saelkia tenebricola]|nr:nitroreductase family protein [Candidatus Saelkia tenebricola]